jgi:hypothetical protein
METTNRGARMEVRRIQGGNDDERERAQGCARGEVVRD